MGLCGVTTFSGVSNERQYQRALQPRIQTEKVLRNYSDNEAVRSRG